MGKSSVLTPNGTKREREACLGLGNILGLLVAPDGCPWRLSSTGKKLSLSLGAWWLSLEL